MYLGITLSSMIILKSFFYLFAIQEGDRWLSWKEVQDFAIKYNLLLPPILYMGKGLSMSDVKKLMDINAELKSGLATATKPEGFVIRMIDSFQCKDFVNCVAKYVRKTMFKLMKHGRGHGKKQS